MVTTVQSAAAKRGVPHQRIRYYIAFGRVSCERAGGVYILDPETARRELEEAGYYERLALWQQKKRARAAAQSW